MKCHVTCLHLHGAPQEVFLDVNQLVVSSHPSLVLIGLLILTSLYPSSSLFFLLLLCLWGKESGVFFYLWHVQACTRITNLQVALSVGGCG